MTQSLKRICSVCSAMLILHMSVRPAIADEHIVPLTELQQQLRSAAEERARDAADIERVLSYPAAVKEFARYNVSPNQVREAVATLSESELARLSDRARAAEADVEGGVVIGILALIGLIVVIIIVVAIVAEAAPPAVDVDTYASAEHGRVEGGAPFAQVAAIHG